MPEAAPAIHVLNNAQWMRFQRAAKWASVGGMNEIDRKVSFARACPLCGKPSDAAFKPFCSKRCADIDLNRWLKGVYAVPAKEEEDEDGQRPPQGEDDRPS